jgi:hypothetical protein
VGVREQPPPELADEGEVIAFEPEPEALEPDAPPLEPDKVVPASEEVVVPPDPPLAEPVEASSGPPPPADPPPASSPPPASGPPPPTPESTGASAPPSTGVVAMPVAPQKTRIAPLVLVIVTPVRTAGAGLGVISTPSMVWFVGSKSLFVVSHLPVFVTT